MLVGVVTTGVFVAAENIHRIAADPQARSRNRTLINRIAHRGVGRACAFGPHVPLRRKARHQVGPRGENGGDRALRRRLLDRLQVFGAWMQEQMHVSINQSWQERRVTEVDDLRSRRTPDRRTDLGDPIPFDQHFAGCDNGSALNVQQPRGVQHHRVSRSRRPRLSQNLSQNRGEENAR